MKNMRKLSRGKGFRGVLNYAFDRKGNPVKGILIGGTMGGTTINELSREFGIFRRQREDIEKPVWHQSLRLPEGESLSAEKWNEIGHDYMKRMGFDEDKHQYAFILHDSDHIHIIANRIDINGQVWLGKNENLESTRHVAQMEIDHNLTRTKNLEYEQGPDGEYTIKPGQEMGNRPPMSRKEHYMEEKKTLDTFMKGEAYTETTRERLSSRVDKALEGGATTAEFIDRMQADNQVKVLPNIKDKGNGKEMVGFTFEFEDHKFKGSQVNANWKDLITTKGLHYDNNTDFELLQATRQGNASTKSAPRRNKPADSELTTAKARDSSGRFTTSSDSIGNIERDMPELPERTTGAKPDLSNTGREPKQSTPTSVRIVNAILGTKANEGSGRLQERSNQPYNESQHSEGEAGRNSRDVKENDTSTERTRDFNSSQHAKLDKRSDNSSDVGNGNDAISKLLAASEDGKTGTISSKSTTASPNPYFGDPSTDSTTSTKEKIVKSKGSWKTIRPTTVGESELLPTPDDEEEDIVEKAKRVYRPITLPDALQDRQSDEYLILELQLEHCGYSAYDIPPHIDMLENYVDNQLNNDKRDELFSRNILDVNGLDEWTSFEKELFDNLDRRGDGGVGTGIGNWNPSNAPLSPGQVEKSIKEQLGDALAEDARKKNKANSKGIDRG